MKGNLFLTDKHAEPSQISLSRTLNKQIDQQLEAQKRPIKVIHIRIRPRNQKSINDNQNMIHAAANNKKYSSLTNYQNLTNNKMNPTILKTVQNTPYVFTNHMQRSNNTRMELATIPNYFQPMKVGSKKHRLKSSKISHSDNKSNSDYSNNNSNTIKKSNTPSDRFGILNDHHRYNMKNRKETFSPKTKLIIVAIVGLIVVIIVSVIVVLLLLLQSKATIVPEAILRWNQTGTTVAGTSGTSGNANNQLNNPLHAMVDYKNTLYVTDTSNHRIQKFLKDSTIGITVCGNGINGSSPNQLTNPSMVEVDSSGNVRVADMGNHRIQLCYDGTIAGITIASIGGLGSSNNQSNRPYGIIYNSMYDTLYVVDYVNNRIMSYLSGATSGVLVAGGNGFGMNSTQLARPLRMYLDQISNKFIIVNHHAHNIISWASGSSNWTLVAGDITGNPGNNATKFNFPTHVTFDPMGNMYVADRNNHRIQLFMYGETEGKTIVGVNGVFGNNDSLLRSPWSVELDNQLNLYVADSSNHRIQKFSRY